MGIFDFLGDLSSKRSKELGLGGIQSLLGTRRAAQAGAIGDEMMGITNKDSLPGYFNEQTREYVPWYVDLFDGGGLNAAGGQAEQAAAQSAAAAAGAMPGGAPAQSPGLLQTRLGSQLSDMERANRNRAAQMVPSLGSQLSDMELANRNRVSQMTPGLGSQLSDMEMANRNRASQMAPSLGSQLSDMEMANRNRASPQAIPASGGNMAINTPAAQGRDQMIADQQMLVKEQAMKKHPKYPEYVDFLNRYNLKPFPGLFERYLKTVGAL
jgi:hypothetical protein